MKKTIPLITLSSLLLLTACSGGSGGASDGSITDASTAFGESMTAQFIDAPVKGLKFKTASDVQSQTGDAGKFACKRGELVSFSLGGLDLGYAACGDKIFVQDLLSDTPNYSWDQAAAVLQTFSVNKGAYLDLSSLDHTQLDLTTISYEVVPANLNLAPALAAASAAYAAVDAGERPSTAVTAANAKTEANNSFSSHVTLSTQLSSVLSQLKDGGASSIVLDGELVSESLIAGLEEETCWKNIKAKSEVVNADGVYSFKINSAVSFDNSADLESDSSCSVGNANADKCETASRLPMPKIISGENFDMIFSSDYSIQSFNVTEQNVLSVQSSLAQNKVNFSGVYENKVTIKNGPLSGKSLVCKYKISGNKPVQIVTENSGSTSKYTGALACSDDTNAPISATIRAEVEMTGSYSDAVASIKIFNNNVLAWSNSALMLQEVANQAPNSQGRIFTIDGLVSPAIGPVAAGGDFILTKYYDHSHMGNKLTLSIGIQSAHCDSYDGLQKE